MRPEDRETKGERFILDLIDWEANGDPHFYENHHLSPQPDRRVAERRRRGAWIYYNTTKFSGKKLVVHPGCSYVTHRSQASTTSSCGPGSGTYGGLPVQGGDPTVDEVLVTHDRAVPASRFATRGREDLLAIKFFGPDVNPDVPMIRAR